MSNSAVSNGHLKEMNLTQLPISVKFGWIWNRFIWHFNLKLNSSNKRGFYLTNWVSNWSVKFDLVPARSQTNQRNGMTMIALNQKPWHCFLHFHPHYVVFCFYFLWTSVSTVMSVVPIFLHSFKLENSVLQQFYKECYHLSRFRYIQANWNESLSLLWIY